MPIQQPSGQIKFTNVSIVRLKKGKKRFELACYKNKLLEYRNGTETDLDNVLQVPTIFLQVSKGNTAPNNELAKAFGKTPKEEIIQEILRKGEIQVGERERKEVLDRVEREVLELVSSRLVDPVSKRVYTTGMIQKALNQLSSASGQQQQQTGEKEKSKGKATIEAEKEQEHAAVVKEKQAREEAGETPDDAAAHSAHAQRKPLWTGVAQNKSAKSQALDAIKALIAWQPIPVMRARMRLRITCPTMLLKQTVKASAPSSTADDTASEAAEEKPSKGSNKKGKGGKKKGENKHNKGADDDEGEQGGAPPAPASKTVKDRILGYFDEVESQEVMGDEWEVVGFAEPGAFKGLSEFVGGETKGRGRVEVLDMAVTHED
ncbi:hypothetical protein KEM55_003239 [Ascosphaera atra]|nr:hypothetical protein KEM55_003239 [Ascosphaera atra]